MTSETSPHRTIAVLGDSIADGLGVAKQAYPDLLPEFSGRPTVVRNLSGSGQTIADCLARVSDVAACRPDVVIVAQGNFDAVVRPTDNAMRWIPPRWRVKGWLDPRPYFSRRLCKGIYQRIESAVRWRYRILLLRQFGGLPWTPPSEFRDATRALVDAILRETDATVLLLTPTGINGRFYPGTPASMETCRAILQAVATEYVSIGRVRICDVSSLLDPGTDYFADGFHPNLKGHRKLARAISEHVT